MSKALTGVINCIYRQRLTHSNTVVLRLISTVIVPIESLLGQGAGGADRGKELVLPVKGLVGQNIVDVVHSRNDSGKGGGRTGEKEGSVLVDLS